LKKEYLIEKHLRQKGLEMKDVHTFNLNNDETDDEILHQRLTSYILSDLGIKRSRILSKYYYIMSVFLT
jgi:HD superfamily phosphohydrolase YqeK